ncbi:hypothetical protein ACFWDQ_35035, partial [Streptomyces sp. NPDC060053]|uniref:hypothetical protein n=1 Tax=Streptomyces sp. NPDC060053 TaxID=3347047 RepID=UPI00369706D1
TAPHPGRAQLLATLVVLTVDPLTADPLVAADVRTGAGAVLVSDGALEVRFPDGTTETVTPVPDPG